ESREEGAEGEREQERLAPGGRGREVAEQRGGPDGARPRDGVLAEDQGGDHADGQAAREHARIEDGSQKHGSGLRQEPPQPEREAGPGEGAQGAAGGPEESRLQAEEEGEVAARIAERL